MPGLANIPLIMQTANGKTELRQQPTQVLHHFMLRSSEIWPVGEML
jgi:hypothetical protein